MSEEHGPYRLKITDALLRGERKVQAYEATRQNLLLTLADITDPVVKMATIASEFTEHFPRSQHFWTGFYRVDETPPSDRFPNGRKQLVVGPYQGTLGCLYIPYENGVCGAVATLERAKIVPDTSDIRSDPEIHNVIECDSVSKSEIVVPIFGRNHKLIGVYDVDSAKLNAFDEVDQRYLEAIMQDHFSMLDTLMSPPPREGLPQPEPTN